jgi:sphingomyelin phosphodiesterase acid-like 3
MKYILKYLLVIIFICPGHYIFGQAQNEILCVSDIHFDPFTDPNINTMFKTGYKQWHFREQTLSPMGTDANFLLVDKMFKKMKEENSHPQYIIVTGDFLCHNLLDIFRSKCKGCSPGDEKMFISNTVKFICDSFFKKYFPGATILPALGNNDSYSGDYDLNPDCQTNSEYCDSGFLSVFAQAWAPLVYPATKDKDKTEKDRNDFIRQFIKGGYYSYNMPGGLRHSIIVLNTVLFSKKYGGSPEIQNGNKTNGPADKEMQWLNDALVACKNDGRRAWLVYHIPPGSDLHSSKLFWNKYYNSSFLDLLVTYSSTITANFAGHTHMDESRVFYSDGKPVSFVHITPSFGTNHFNNPAFQLMSYDKDSFGLIAQKTVFFDLAGKHTWGAYNLETEYGIDHINAATLNDILNNSAFTEKYLRHYYCNSN